MGKSLWLTLQTHTTDNNWTAHCICQVPINRPAFTFCQIAMIACKQRIMSGVAASEPQKDCTTSDKLLHFCCGQCSQSLKSLDIELTSQTPRARDT